MSLDRKTLERERIRDLDKADERLRHAKRVCEVGWQNDEARDAAAAISDAIGRLRGVIDALARSAAPAPVGEGGADRPWTAKRIEAETLRPDAPAPPVGETRGGERSADLERVARYWLKDCLPASPHPSRSPDERTDWIAPERPWRPNPAWMEHGGQRTIWLTREEWDDIGRVLGVASEEGHDATV